MYVIDFAHQLYGILVFQRHALMGFKSQAHMDMVDYLRIPYNEIIFFEPSVPLFSDRGSTNLRIYGPASISSFMSFLKSFSWPASKTLIYFLYSMMEMENRRFKKNRPSMVHTQSAANATRTSTANSKCT
jgi:hypothetical protein